MPSTRPSYILPSILYIFPHPDDESFGPGPAIARQRREGHEVHLLTLTKGGATKQRHRLGLTVEAMGDVREKEMQCVARELGLTSLKVLDIPDGGMKYMDPLEIEGIVHEHVRTIRPDVLVTYAVHGISGHPDHLVCHSVVKHLYCRMRRDRDTAAPRRLALFTLVQGEMEGAAAHLKGSPPSDIGARVTFTAEDRAAGEAALACYETYREVIEEHRPLEVVRHGIAFELFGEKGEEPIGDLFAQLPDQG